MQFNNGFPALWAESVICSKVFSRGRTLYERNTDTHILTLEGKAQCRLQDGDIVLPMDEF